MAQSGIQEPDGILGHVGALVASWVYSSLLQGCKIKTKNQASIEKGQAKAKREPEKKMNRNRFQLLNHSYFPNSSNF